MEWATTIFPIENRFERSEFIERIWRTRSVPEFAMLSVATPHCQIVVVSSLHAPMSVIVRGPETQASVVEIPQDAEFVGIEFKVGTFLPSLAIATLLDTGARLDVASRTKMHLAGRNWEIPNFENAGDFVAHLAREGALVRDQVVEQTLLRKPVALTDRSVQRRFVRATGLTYGAVRQIERAERTASLLTAGTSIADAIDLAGYSDQAHMTRSLQRFLGKTPGKLGPQR